MANKKLSAAKQEKLDRLHKRDCPAAHDIELQPCLTCVDIQMREFQTAPPTATDGALGTLDEGSRGEHT